MDCPFCEALTEAEELVYVGERANDRNPNWFATERRADMANTESEWQKRAERAEADLEHVQRSADYYARMWVAVRADRARLEVTLARVQALRDMYARDLKPGTWVVTGMNQELNEAMHCVVIDLTEVLKGESSE